MSNPLIRGPLTGVKVVEFTGIGPAPFAAMLLADLGATVLRIDRETPGLFAGPVDFLARGRTALTLDLKTEAGRTRALTALDHADILLEGFRPGVMERLGLGPDVVLARNPRLVYGRVTGWGQDGPLAPRAGHDITYIAVAGALGAMGPAGGPPTPPLNLVGDFGGGGMLLAVGVLGALLAARTTGQGQVVDAAMVDGTALLMAYVMGLRASGMWPGPPGTNPLDGGAHFYRCYRCADGRWLAIGAIEDRFYRECLERLGIEDPAFDHQWDPARWPELSARMAAHLATRPRDAWCALVEGSDACVVPVLEADELTTHPHLAARGSWVDRGQGPEPAPAPRFSGTPANPLPADRETTLRAFGL